jgi:exonuclease SbcD
LTTVHDLSPGRSLPNPIVVEVTNVTWNAGKSRRAEVAFTDTEGNELRLIDYEGANISVDWQPGRRYKISRCGVQEGSGKFDVELAPSKKTRIEALGPTQTTHLLVIGDTHVGRTTHPGTGERINPGKSFRTAIQYGIDRGIDAVVHAGDIFHESATPTDADYVDAHVFAPLATADIPFYYVTGNHEAQSGTELLEQRDGSLVTNLDCTGTTINSHVRLFGTNHYSNGDLPWRNITFPDTVAEPVSLLIIHQTLEQLSGPGTNAVDLTCLHRRFNGCFDFILSGHHHDAIQDTWKDTPVMYTGAAEHMSTNENPVDRVAWLLKSQIAHTSQTSKYRLRLVDQPQSVSLRTERMIRLGISERIANGVLSSCSLSVASLNSSK